jgi:hypothetical protein
MVLISITIQFVLIKKTKESINVERSKSRLGKSVLVIANVLQYSAAGILVIILFQVIFTSKYSVDLLETVVGINLITSNVLLAILFSRLVRTYRTSPSKAVLAYSISIAVLSLSSIITFIYVDNFLQGKSDSITSTFSQWNSYSPTISPRLSSAYQVVGIMSFVYLWIATVLLTYDYAKSKRIKYWIIVNIPLVYFASLYIIPFLEHLDILGALGVDDNPIYAYSYNFFLNMARTAGGIMFGIAFVVLSRNIVHIQLKKSIIMTGISLILLFEANASSLIIMTPYPPWGSISITFMIIGSYLLIIGLDSAAFYLATDSSLRSSVARSLQKEYDFLNSLGYSEAQDVVTVNINRLTKQVYDEIEPENLFISSEPDNVHEYIREVLSEVRRGDRNLLQKGKNKLPTGDQK